MGSMAIKINVKMVAGEYFSLGAKADPYSMQSAAWRFYEAEYHALTNSTQVGVADGSI
jgi:hypothetical protein